jgi:hypothetical protein
MIRRLIPSPEFLIENGWFNTGRAFVKALLCLFAYHEPKSFSDNAKVNINNNWLKRINSKNYHHFFPRAYLKKKGYDDDNVINNIVNITIVDDFLNKAEIGSKPPSAYIKKFEKSNKHLAATMKTHLITDLNKFGVRDNDYEGFLNQRALAISRELGRRIIRRAIDERGQAQKKDDVEETDDVEEENAPV